MKNTTQLPPSLMPRERKDTGLIVTIFVCAVVVFGALLFAASFAAEADGAAVNPRPSTAVSN